MRRKATNNIFVIHSNSKWSRWRFRHLADGNGRSAIQPEIDSRGVAFKAALNTWLRHLETIRNLGRPYVAKLQGECDGLLEIILTVDRIQYRPLACYGPNRGDITILFIAEEHGNRFVPLDACGIALRRKALIDADHTRVVDHRYI